MSFSRWRVVIRRLTLLALEPAIAGAICGLILSLNSTEWPMRLVYAALGFNNLIAFLITISPRE